MNRISAHALGVIVAVLLGLSDSHAAALAIAQQAYLKPSAVGTTQAGDHFGYYVAVSGDTVVVGAPYEDSSTTGLNSAPNESENSAGAVYVFARGATGWKQQAYLKPAAIGTTQAGDCFGCSVAIAGDTIIVGAYGEDSGTTGVNSTPDESAVGSGAAYVFVRNGTNWTQQAYLKPASVGTSQQHDGFGFSVSASGDTVVVGTPYEDSSTTGVNSAPDDGGPFNLGTYYYNSGAAYVFVRSGTNWTQQAFLKAATVGTTHGNDYFGTSVAVSGDTVVVGANGEDSSSTGVNSTPNESASSAGAAYVFARSGTNWSQQAYLKPASVGTSQADDYFGGSVSVSGDTVIVGAYAEDSSSTGVNSTPNESASSAGAAYLFVRTGTNWIQQAYLKPAANGTSQVDDYFGAFVAASGDKAVVGASGGAGAAYAFTRSGTNWTQQASLLPATVGNTPMDDRFGWAAAIAGDTIVIGAPWEDSGSTGVNSVANESSGYAGAAYIFAPGPEIEVQQPAGVSLLDGVSNVNFGDGLVGSTNQRTFIITNSGTADLTGLGLTIDGANAGEFSVLASPAASLPPGGSTSFTIAFIPVAGGIRTAALHIGSNDADENPFDLALSSLAFGDPDPNCPASFSPSSRSHGYAPAPNSVHLYAPCAWTAVVTNSWITITSPTNGNTYAAYSTTLYYTVAVNTDPQPRSGNIRVGSALFSITQAGGHPVIVTQPANQTVAGGGTATFSVTINGAPPYTCQWQFNGMSLTDGDVGSPGTELEFAL